MFSCRYCFLLAIFLVTVPASAQNNKGLTEILNSPIVVERTEEKTTIPIERHMGKLAVEVSINGLKNQFIFDTGSPTMISKKLADKLELKIIGSNVGRDANGQEVKTEIAIVERLKLGSTTFLDVPVMIFDFDKIDPKGCFIKSGVIGSEIFPGSTWSIDADNLSLEIKSPKKVPAKESGYSTITSVPLYDFGYPHAPIFEYGIGDFKDRGLFDTGNSSSFILFKQVADDQHVRKFINPDSVQLGRGTEGISAGGIGKETELQRFELKAVKLGRKELGPFPGIVRNAPPTLMGLGMLANYNITLDYPNSQLILKERTRPEKQEATTGFNLMLLNGQVRVVQLFTETAAELAGLKLGDQVVAIDGVDIDQTNEKCGLEKWLIETLPASAAKSLTVFRNGKREEISLERN